DASAPSLCIDMCEAILSVPAIEFAELGDKMLLIKTEFSDDVKLEGYFILVPDLTSYEKILTSLGM
ncbi:MAG: CheY-P-specific phosphatase CheC, partial [Lachnospiraceae bacterium]|nr:CheY-P-specific phosphatase CheC [Lachnospiraceae bacterium]